MTAEVNGIYHRHGRPPAESFSKRSRFAQIARQATCAECGACAAVAAVLSGAQSLTTMSQWGREQNAECLRGLGSTHWAGPCVATLHRTFRGLDVVALQTVLTA